MSRTVLLALDGSAKDERGIAVAAAFAELAGASVREVRIGDPPLEANDVVAAILRAAEENDARAIVLAARGAGAIGRAVHGSVADAVVRGAQRPVLLVPPRTDDMRGQQVHLRRILVPLDGSDAAREIVGHLLDLAPGKPEIVLLRAVASERTGGHAMPPGHHGAAARHAESQLREIADHLRRFGVHADVRVVESGDPASVILAAIREELVDVIAMATRGAGGARRLLHGSVATRVARESEVPVLLVTPGLTPSTARA